MGFERLVVSESNELATLIAGSNELSTRSSLTSITSPDMVIIVNKDKFRRSEGTLTR